MVPPVTRGQWSEERSPWPPRVGASVAPVLSQSPLLSLFPPVQYGVGGWMERAQGSIPASPPSLHGTALTTPGLPPSPLTPPCLHRHQPLETPSDARELAAGRPLGVSQAGGALPSGCLRACLPACLHPTFPPGTPGGAGTAGPWAGARPLLALNPPTEHSDTGRNEGSLLVTSETRVGHSRVGPAPAEGTDTWTQEGSPAFPKLPRMHN